MQEEEDLLTAVAEEETSTMHNLVVQARKSGIQLAGDEGDDSAVEPQQHNSRPTSPPKRVTLSLRPH